MQMRMSALILVLNACICLADPECVEFNQHVVGQLSGGQLHEAEVALSNELSVHSLPASCEWIVLHDMAVVMSRAGRVNESERYADRAVRILEAGVTADNPALLRPLHMLSIARLELGNVAGAREAFRRMEKVRLEQPVDRALFHGTAATVLQAEGAHAEAEKEYFLCLAAWEESGVYESADVADVLNGLVDLYITDGRLHDAANALRRAVAIFAVAKDAGPVDQVRVLNSKGVLDAKLGQLGQAEEDFRSALRLADEVPELDAAMLGGLLGNYAHVLRENRHAREAGVVERRLNALEASRAKDAVVDVADLKKR